MIGSVYKATIKLITMLGFPTYGHDVYPRVEIEQPTEDAGICKDNSDSECELLIDVITKSTSPTQSYIIADSLRNNLHLIKSDEIDIFDVEFVNQSTMHEYTDTVELYRQLIRVRFLTSNK